MHAKRASLPSPSQRSSQRDGEVLVAKNGQWYCSPDDQVDALSLMNCHTDGKRVAYYRGRKLQGRHVKIPDGYRGVVLKSTDRSVPQGNDNTDVAQLEYDALAEQDEGAEDEPVKILEEHASFDAVVLWGHESTPDENDPYVKGIKEWIAFAETMHSTGPSTVATVHDKRSP